LQVACLPATRGKKKVKSSSEENGAVYEGRKALWMRGRAILEKRSSGASTAENKEARRRGALDTHTRTHMHTHIALVMLFAEMHAVLTVFFFFSSAGAWTQQPKAICIRAVLLLGECANPTLAEAHKSKSA
jgi:hypothetical protein